MQTKRTKRQRFAPGVMNTQAVELIQKLLEKLPKRSPQEIYLNQVAALSGLSQGLAAFEQTAAAFWELGDHLEYVVKPSGNEAEIAAANKAYNKASRKHSRSCDQLEAALNAAKQAMKPARKPAAA
jgi:hypothetical protein